MDPVIIAAMAIVSLIIVIPIIIKKARSHICKFGEIKEDGYQYCPVCNTAKKPTKAPCPHKKWKVIKEHDVTAHGSKTGEIHILRCESCGDLKKFSFSCR